MGVQHFIRIMALRDKEFTGKKGLVVGFGEGHEADFLQTHTHAKIIGIDIRSRIPVQVKPGFSPVLASALKIPCADETFDFVFYHHVIEHVPDPQASLTEINRILMKGGILYVGTPNRNRLIGYLGAHKISVWRIIRNNLVDYKYRLLGKFRNEFGAHAGFNKKELGLMIDSHFTDLGWLTEDYLEYKYKHRLPRILLNFLFKPAILDKFASSIYLICQKPTS
jgi:ubiquinone/menaquinone biosynthesis C-methylase UbiE